MCFFCYVCVRASKEGPNKAPKMAIQVPNISGLWSKNHTLNGFCDQSPQILGTWTLWVMFVLMPQKTT